MALQLAGCDTATISDALINRVWGDMLTFRAFVPEMSGPIPRWWLAAAQEDLKSAIRDVPEVIDERRTAFEKLFVEAMAATAPPQVMRGTTQGMCPPLLVLLLEARPTDRGPTLV